MKDWESIKAICNKADSGPWEVHKPGVSNGWVCVQSPGEIFSNEIATLYGEENVKNNSGFIATARTALPEAIAEIEQLLAENEEVLIENELLRQDKAELVELAESLLSAMDSLSEPQTVEDVAFQKSITEKASAILAKHGGEPK